MASRRIITAAAAATVTLSVLAGGGYVLASANGPSGAGAEDGTAAAVNSDSHGSGTHGSVNAAMGNHGAGNGGAGHGAENGKGQHGEGMGQHGEAGGEHGEGEGRGMVSLASFLGLKVEELEARVAAGETPEQIAVSEGKTVAELEAFMNAMRSNHMNEKVKAGEMTKEQAEQQLNEHGGEECATHDEAGGSDGQGRNGVPGTGMDQGI